MILLFFKQKTAYEVRISDWSSDVCSSDLVDEIHRLNPAVEEVLYPAMEDRALDLMIGEGPSARSVRIDLPQFTLIGATTRQGLLTTPLRDRFGIPVRLNFYRSEEHTSELQSLMRISYAVFCLKKKKQTT